MNVNNTGWVNYAETTFTDGIHTIQYRATDNAGNVTETTVQEIKVDTVTPVINTSTTGTLGLSNWYVSNVTMNATSSDSTSAIASFEMNVNNTGWVTYAENTFTDGIISIQYRAIDNAGNTYTTTEQQIKVDTITPSLNLATTGTKGQNDWYISQTSVTPTSTDAGSGIASIEYRLNNGTFNLYTSPLQFIDGIHTYQFQITDNAGNITTTPSLTLKVDTIAPVVDMDDEIDLGDTLYYSLEDNGSGLWVNRTVIEDEDEKYKKVVWLEEISGYKVESDILWDGKFKDGTSAPVGDYYITLKISDQAGNETFRTAVVNVNPLSFLQVLPPFTPPTTNEALTNQQDNQPTNELTFGNENNNTTSNETTSTNLGGEAVFQNVTAQSGALTSFTSGNENTVTPITNTEILWGAMATAVLGATLAEWQRKREEEEARQRELDRIAQMEKNAERKAEQARLDYLNAAYQAKLDREREKQNAVASARWNGIAKIEEAKQEAKKIASQNTFNHLTNEHKDQKSVYVSKVNAGGSKPLATLAQTTTTSWFGQQLNNLKDVFFSSGDESPTFLDRLFTNSDWNQARNSTIDALNIQQQKLIHESGGQSEDYYYYTENFLGLNKWRSTMSINQIQELERYIDIGQVSWRDTLNQVDTLQNYFGYNNKTMVTTLRELYYSSTLDPFIENSKEVNSTIYSILGNRNGITSGEAAFSRAILLLTTQGHGYTQAVVQVQHPIGYNTSGEFAFDHIIGAIDGNFNQIKPENISLGSFGEIYANLIGLDKTKIETVPAVTYIGDLAGSTAVGFQYSDPLEGYRIEMSQSDLEGDILGVVIAKNNAINPNGNNLSEELSNALSPNSPYVTNMYTKFARILNIEYNPQTGSIFPASTQTFLNQNKELIADLGAGFYASQPPKINVPTRVWNGGNAYFAQPTLESYAKIQITTFLEQLNQGLQGEFDK